MAIDFRDLGSNALALLRTPSGAPFTAVPCSISAWFYVNQAASRATVAVVSTQISAPDFFRLVLFVPSAGNLTIGANAQNTSGTNGLGQATPIPEVVGTWIHGAAVFASTSSRSGYINGGGKGTNANSCVPASITLIRIGGLFSTGTGESNTNIADVGFWNIALTDAEVLALAKGVSPTMIRPSGLQAYYPLFDESTALNNYWRGTTIRTLTVSDGSLVGTTVPGPPVGDRFSFRPLGGYLGIGGSAGEPEAVNLAVGIPSFGAGVLGQKHALAANALTITPAVFSAPLLKQTHTLAPATALSITPPAFGTAIFIQKHVIARLPLTAASPDIPVGVVYIPGVLSAAALILEKATLDAAVLAQNQVLLPGSLTANKPVFDAPVSTRTFVLPAPNDVTAGAAVFSTGILLQKQTLPLGASFATVAPAFSVAVLGQAGVMQAMPLQTTGHVFSAPALGQKHVFGVDVYVNTPWRAIQAVPEIGQAHNLATGGLTIPLLGLAAAPFGLKYTLPTATSLKAGSPTLGSSPVGQSHVVLATPLVMVKPVFVAGTLGQKHVVAPTNLAGRNPVLDSVNFYQAGTFGGGVFVVAAPTIPAGVLTQKHIFTAVALATIPPALSVPRSSNTLIPVALALAAPSITASVVGFSHLLQATSLRGSYPHIGVVLVPELIAPPEVWLRHRLTRWSNIPGHPYYDDDHSQNEGPVKQAIFSNLNDDIELTINSRTLVGRTSPGRGAAQTIQVAAPLRLEDLTLRLSGGDLREYGNDAAAAAAGVPVGGLYHVGGFIKVRVS